MNRKRAVANNQQTGQARRNLYGNCIDRYKEAMADGYYLEAIALVESLIADRLMSYLVFKGYFDGKNQFQTLERSLSPLQKDGDFPEDLWCKIEDWKNKRNSNLHEMAKFEEGDSPIFKEKYTESKIAAEEGYSIFTAIKKFENANRKHNAKVISLK